MTEKHVLSTDLAALIDLKLCMYCRCTTTRTHLKGKVCLSNGPSLRSLAHLASEFWIYIKARAWRTCLPFKNPVWTAGFGFYLDVKLSQKASFGIVRKRLTSSTKWEALYF